MNLFFIVENDENTLMTRLVYKVFYIRPGITTRVEKMEGRQERDRERNRDREKDSQRELNSLWILGCRSIIFQSSCLTQRKTERQTERKKLSE